MGVQVVAHGSETQMGNPVVVSDLGIRPAANTGTSNRKRRFSRDLPIAGFRIMGRERFAESRRELIESYHL